MWILTLLDIKYRAIRFAVVTVGTALVFTLLFLMTGLIEQFNQEPFLMVERISESDWAVPEGTSGPFTSSSVIRPDQVAALAGTPLLIARGTLEIDSEESEGIVIGAPTSILTDVPLQDGDAPRASRTAIADVSTGLDVGSTFGLGGTDFTVAGLSEDTTLLAGQPAIFVDIRDARDAMFGGGDITMAVLVDAGRTPDVEGITVLTASQVAEDALGPLENAVSSIDLIRVLLWVVAGIIIGAVVYLSALERQRDFAVLLAVGGRTRQLSLSLAIQAVFVAVVAVAIAAGLQAIVVPVFPLKVRVPVSALWQVPLVAIVVSLLAASAAMRRVRRTDPAEAFGGPA